MSSLPLYDMAWVCAEVIRILSFFNRGSCSFEDHYSYKRVNAHEQNILFPNQRKVLGNQMMSEKKNKSPTPEAVAMGELKRVSKENMSLVRTRSFPVLLWKGGG